MFTSEGARHERTVRFRVTDNEHVLALLSALGLAAWWRWRPSAVSGMPRPGLLCLSSAAHRVTSTPASIFMLKQAAEVMHVTHNLLQTAACDTQAYCLVACGTGAVSSTALQTNEAHLFTGTR